MKDGMAQHTGTQKKGEVLKLVKEISTRARAKAVKIMGRYGLRLFQERKRTSGSEITPLLSDVKDGIQKKGVESEAPEKREESNQEPERKDRTGTARTYNQGYEQGIKARTSVTEKENLIEQLRRQTYQQQVELQDSLWRSFLLVCWFQYHYQQLLLAYQVQQKLLYYLYQQHMSESLSNGSTRGPSTPSESISIPPMATSGTPIVMHPLPLPGSPGAPPTFNGRDVTSFLKKYESMCDTYQIQTPMRLKKVSEYCEDDVAREIEAFTTWEEKDWEKLKTEMLHEWRREDTEQIMYTRAFLEEYVGKPRGRDGLKHYYRQYDRISRALVIKDELDSYSQGRLFITGLPEKVRNKVLSKQEIFSGAPAGSVIYLKALAAVQAIVQAEEMKEHFDVQPERQTSISNLADSLNEVKPGTKETQMRPSNSTAGKSQPKEDAVELLTKSLEALTLPITAAVTRMEAAAATMSSMGQGPANRPGGGLDPALERRQPQHFGVPFSCYFCGETGHIKSRCSHFGNLLSSGKIHVNSQGGICLGPPKEGAVPIWRMPNMTMLQAVERQLNMQSPPTTANFGFIKVDYELDSDVEVSEDEHGSTMADAFGARADVQKGKKPAGRPGVIDPVKDARTRATKQTAQKQSQYPVMKSLRTGVWEPEGDEPSGTATEPSRDNTMEMEEDLPAESGQPTQKGSKVPMTSLKKLLAGHSDPMSVVERMLQQPLTISWGEALSLSGDLRKVMFGTFKDPKAGADRAVDVQISKMGANIEDEEEHASEVLEKATEPYYIAASPMANVIIGQTKIPALIDSGAEVTVMTADLAWSLGLPMSQNFQVNMSAATGRSKRFVGLCEDVPISVGKITHKVPVWVIDKLEHGLILGRTYHKAAGLKLEEMDDGSCSATIFTPDRTGMVRWRAVSANAKRNQSRDDLLSKHALNSQAEA
jgi:hypothetical protein